MNDIIIGPRLALAIYVAVIVVFGVSVALLIRTFG